MPNWVAYKVDMRSGKLMKSKLSEEAGKFAVSALVRRHIPCEMMDIFVGLNLGVKFAKCIFLYAKPAVWNSLSLLLLQLFCFLMKFLNNAVPQFFKTDFWLSFITYYIHLSVAIFGCVYF